MNWDSKHAAGDSKTFECECGAKLEVKFAVQAGHNEREEFNCPKCKREHSVRASRSISESDVRVLT